MDDKICSDEILTKICENVDVCEFDKMVQCIILIQKEFVTVLDEYY